MIIEGNQKELDAMKEFHRGNRQEGLKLQEEFAAAFREAYRDKDHCPCQKACRYHGNCKECVAIHRAHQEHVPNCMRPIPQQQNPPAVRADGTYHCQRDRASQRSTPKRISKINF